MTKWQDKVKLVLSELIKEYALPEGSLYLSENKGQNNSELTISYSVCIWEPDYPRNKTEKTGMNKIVTTISPSTVKSRPDDLDLFIREAQEGDLHEYLPDDAELLQQTKSDKMTGTVKVRFKTSSETLPTYIKKNTEYCIENYVSKADSFGCCSRFNDCSDAKKCVHENKLYSKACMYRNNLDNGRIFYGKNRNIE